MCQLSQLLFSADKDLSLPPLATSCIECLPLSTNCTTEQSKKERDILYSNLPFAKSKVFQVPIESANVLCEGNHIKTVVELWLNINNVEIDYLPGDTIGVLPQNADEDSNYICERLCIDKDSTFSIVFKNKLKKKTIFPKHLPSVATVDFLFKSCLDLRAVVKKAFLRSLIEFTTDLFEIRRLKELCSREGSDEYNEYILKNKSSILDILEAFPSCLPPLSVLLEYVPRLQPRVYSIASSPLEDCDKLRIVFNVIYDSRNRRGICSGWLHDISQPFYDVTSQLSRLDLHSVCHEHIKIPMYLRKETNFRIPQNPSVPLIMIGPGTGVAPFIGFLEHRRKQIAFSPSSNDGWLNWIFFGCRHENKDEIYKDKLKLYESENLCYYLVTYSRDVTNNELKYVQDMLKLKKVELVKQIFSTDTIIFICGDGLNMSRDVTTVIVECIQSVKGLTFDEAMETVKTFEKNGRIVKDVWL